MVTQSTDVVSGPDIQVTKIFAEFIANVDSDVLSSTVIDCLKEYLLDYLGVTIAAAHKWESTEQIYRAVEALGAHGGSATVTLKGHDFRPQFAGLLNATFGHSMDFDDTYAPGSLHAGVCAISAGLAQAESSETPEVDSRRLLLAIAVGYEVICRLGAELGNAAYARGFHNTSTAGIFGAVAAICVLKKLPTSIVENSFGLALSKAAGSMQYLENGSWNKRLHPGFAVHDAFVCVSLAEAGVLGAARSIEGKYGLLHAYSPRTEHDLAFLTAGLGGRWDFLETALKPYPACRMTHGLIEVAGQYGTLYKDRVVDKITVSLSAENHIVVGARVPNKLHPSNLVDAQFSAYFQLAHAWFYGSDTGIEFAGRLNDERIHELSEKITIVTDPTVKAFGSKIHVQFEGGQSHQADIPYPLGEVEHPLSKQQIETKYFSLVTPVVGETMANEIKSAVEEFERRPVGALMQLIG
ncbi:2-methylcitrate dehydratase PrpD [Xylaria cf. heliscus]|nr:2-methylcitrate dehydratase PrpD [Xylaria cf. heliscus]